MVLDHLAPEELQAGADCPVVRVPLGHVAVPSRQMARDEANRRVEQVESDADAAFVPRQPLQSGLGSEFPPGLWRT